MTQLAYFSGSYILLSAGKFDTRNRYLRNGTASDRFPIAKERTFVWAKSTSGANRYPSWRFSDGVTSWSYTFPSGGGVTITHDPPNSLVNL